MTKAARQHRKELRDLRRSAGITPQREYHGVEYHNQGCTPLAQFAAGLSAVIIGVLLFTL